MDHFLRAPTFGFEVDADIIHGWERDGSHLSSVYDSFVREVVCNPESPCFEEVELLLQQSAERAPEVMVPNDNECRV
jgi:hypothetical protein